MAVTLRILGEDDRAEIEHVRQYFRNYAGWLGVDLGYQNFAEAMASLPGAYSPPTGRLFFAELDGRPAGCIGIRAATEGVCEMKRLYVEPESRGNGVGRELALAAIKAAKRSQPRHPRILSQRPECPASPPVVEPATGRHGGGHCRTCGGGKWDAPRTV